MNCHCIDNIAEYPAERVLHYLAAALLLEDPRQGATFLSQQLRNLKAAARTCYNINNWQVRIQDSRTLAYQTTDLLIR
ncbi:uncharacterized protein RMCB_4804 [Mycolicibacterium brisbanense]|uniref:Uncharacterized protein n=1 Tax=Mycolicibacterium brisbanense TaxID=146020 RepID=A0A124E0J3_9MYCO|nr:uncharacterized protein RMCB_4804 [Mycolicibacterium brisbanense]